MYTEKDIHAGFVMRNKIGKGSLYTVEAINANNKTMHLQGEKSTNFNSKTYNIAEFVRLLNSGDYVEVKPEIKEPIVNNHYSIL